jgi:hypothetical protein
LIVVAPRHIGTFRANCKRASQMSRWKKTEYLSSMARFGRRPALPLGLISANLSVSQLAEVANLSPRQFSRAFFLGRRWPTDPFERQTVPSDDAGRA